MNLYIELMASPCRVELFKVIWKLSALIADIQ